MNCWLWLRKGEGKLFVICAVLTLVAAAGRCSYIIAFSPDFNKDISQEDASAAATPFLLGILFPVAVVGIILVIKGITKTGDRPNGFTGLLCLFLAIGWSWIATSKIGDCVWNRKYPKPPAISADDNSQQGIEKKIRDEARKLPLKPPKKNDDDKEHKSLADNIGYYCTWLGGWLVIPLSTDLFNVAASTFYNRRKKADEEST